MKCIVYFLSTVFSLNGYCEKALSLGSVASALESLQPQMCVPESDSNGPPSLTTLLSTDFSECLESICGKSQGESLFLKANGYFLEKEAFEIRPEIEKEFRPILEEWIKEKLKNSKLELSQTLDWLQKNDHIKNQAISRIIYSSYVYKFAEEVVLDQERLAHDLASEQSKGSFKIADFDIGKYIDEKKTLKKIATKSLTEQEAEFLIGYIKKIYTKIFKILISKDLSSGGRFAELKLVKQSGLTFRESLLKKMDEIKKSSDLIIQDFEKLFEFNVPKEFISQNENSQRLAVQAVKEARGIPLYLLHDLFEKSFNTDIGREMVKEMILGTNIPPSDSKIFDHWKEKLHLVENISQELRVLNSESATKELSEAVIENCISTFSKTAASYVKQVEYNQTIKKFEKGSQELLNSHLKSWLSQVTFGNWSEYSKKVETIYPPPREDWIKLVKNNLVTEHADEVVSVSVNKSLLKSNPEVILFNAIDFIGLDSTQNEETVSGLNSLEGIIEQCSLHVIDPPRRDYVGENNQVLLTSWSGIKEPETGLAIFLHEYGHVVGNFLNSDLSISKESSQKYNEIKSCLEDRHPECKDSIAWIKKGQLVDEDFADYLSSMSTGKEGLSFACVLLSKDAQNQYVSYSNEKNNYSSFPTIINQNKSDSHSSEAFRVLSTYWNMHLTFPPQCITALKSARMSTDWGKCH